MSLLKLNQNKHYIKEYAVIVVFLLLLFVLSWLVPEAARIPFYEYLRSLDLAGSSHGIFITSILFVILTYIASVGWFGVNSATDIGIPRLEIATATFTKTLVVVASISAVLGTIGSSGGEIASAFFEGFRILPDIVLGNPVDSAGIFSVYVANFSGIVNALAAVFAGVYLIYLYFSKKLSIDALKTKIRELGSPAVLALAVGLFVLYFIQSVVTWDGSPSLSQSSLVVIVGTIIFVVGFSLYKKEDVVLKPKSGRDFVLDYTEKFSLNPRKLGTFLAINAIGNSQNIFVLVPRFVLALSALISMLIVPIEFLLTMLGFNEIVLAFAVAFTTSIVEILLVIASGEIALFLLLGSNVIDVVFGLFFGEVVPQFFGNITYHHSMPAISMYSALFALFTCIGVFLSFYFYKRERFIASAVSFIFWVLLGGLFYNLAVFFNGIVPMNMFISTYLAYLEYPLYYIFWVLTLGFILFLYFKKQKKQHLIEHEVLSSLTKLKDYYDGAIFVVQVDGDSLRKHLGRISFIIKYLMDAERYLGGDGAITLIIENSLIPNVLTKDSYQQVLTNLAHTPPESSKTILNDTLTNLLDKNYIADISLASNNVPLLFISLQSDLTHEDIANAKTLLSTKEQTNSVVFEIGCFDSNSSILDSLNHLCVVATPKLNSTSWFSCTEVGDNVGIETVLETMFDRFSDYIDKLK